MKQGLIFEKTIAGSRAVTLPGQDVPQRDALLERGMLREKAPALPELSERAYLMHYHGLRGEENLPAGFREDALLTRFYGLHPLMDQAELQGALDSMMGLDKLLQRITGLEKFSLQPHDGFDAMLGAMLIAKAYYRMRQQPQRTAVYFDTAAYGSGKALAEQAGFEANVLEDPEALDDTAALLVLQTPNRFGRFEKRVPALTAAAHKAGALTLLDGAMLRGILGVARPGDMGFDMVSMELSETFLPECGKPAGALGVQKELIPYLQKPLVMSHEGGPATLDENRPVCVGRLRAFPGNFETICRAYFRILALGAEGLKARTDGINSGLHTILKELGRDDQACLGCAIVNNRPIWLDGEETGEELLELARRLQAR